MAMKFKRAFLFTLFGTLAVLISGQAMAQTVGYADAIKILASSCGKDIQKYCPKATLGNNGIQNCLQKHQAEVSPTCKEDTVKVFILINDRYVAQQDAPEVCARDIERFCTGMKRAKGYTLQCLLKKPRLSEKCRQIIVDAGWAN